MHVRQDMGICSLQWCSDICCF